MRALVTGASGFIGSYLSRLLVGSGWEVNGLSRTGRKDLFGRETEALDLSHPSHLKRLDGLGPVDVLFHLAGYILPAPRRSSVQQYWRANVLSTYRLLEWAAAGRAGRLVYASSSYAYGLADRYPTPEDEALRPTTVLGWSKASAETLCHVTRVQKGLPVAIARIFTVYGRGAAPQQFLPEALAKLLAARTSGTAAFRDPRPTRDFVFVEDVAEALLRLAAVPLPWAVVNVGTGVETGIGEAVEMLRSLLSLPAERVRFEPASVRADERLGVSRHVADTTRLEELLGWRPTTPLHEGLRCWLTEERVVPAESVGDAGRRSETRKTPLPGKGEAG